MVRGRRDLSARDRRERRHRRPASRRLQRFHARAARRCDRCRMRRAVSCQQAFAARESVVAHRRGVRGRRDALLSRDPRRRVDGGRPGLAGQRLRHRSADRDRARRRDVSRIDRGGLPVRGEAAGRDDAGDRARRRRSLLRAEARVRVARRRRGQRGDRVAPRVVPVSALPADVEERSELPAPVAAAERTTTPVQQSETRENSTTSSTLFHELGLGDET